MAMRRVRLLCTLSAYAQFATGASAAQTGDMNRGKGRPLWGKRARFQCPLWVISGHLSNDRDGNSGHWQEVCNARERLLKRQAEPHRGDDHEKYCKEHNFH
jgi:hypothetical protein